MSFTRGSVEEASPRGSRRDTIDGIAGCLAEQLRLLGYTVTGPNAMPPTEAPAPARAVPSQLVEDDANKAQEAASPPAEIPSAPSARPLTEAPAPARVVPSQLDEKDAHEAHEAESPPARYDFAAYQGSNSGLPRPAGRHEQPAAGPTPALILGGPLGGFGCPMGTPHEIQGFALEPSFFAAAAARAAGRAKLPEST